jgi:hypothetical protein
MSNPHQTAALPCFAGERLPYISLTVAARYQYAVNCGAQAAMLFFSDHHDITLHAHLPASLAYFIERAQQEVKRLGLGESSRDAEVVNAFVAGYLGRIQQELRFMRTPQQPAANQAETAFH